jgi:PAS domain S-box-containing protein
VSSANQAVFLNAIPLLAVAALYLAASVALLPSFWRERRRPSEVEFTLALFFPCGGFAAAVVGAAVLIEQEPLGGNAWLAFAAIVLGLAPGIAFFARWQQRRFLLGAARLAREAEQRTSEQDRVRDRVNAFTAELARTEDVESVSRLLLDQVVELLGVEFASVSMIEGKEARGVLGRLDDEELDWWREVRLDLEEEPSAISSAVFEAAPFPVYDVATSPNVNHRIADRVGAKSGIWIPLIAGETVVAVLAAASTHERRAFAPDEIALLTGLANETALALDRTRSSSALAQALERERLVADLSRRLRGERDLKAAMRLAVAEVGPALRAARCYVHLGALGTVVVGAEWDEQGFEPVGDRAAALPVRDLVARQQRTIEIADVLTAGELDAAPPGSRDVLVELNARAILATPLHVFNEVIGVLGFHRAEAGLWTPQDVALAQAVARELGLVLHTARVLDESERRLGQQSALLKAAEAVTSELEAARVLQRLVDEVAHLVGAEAADCYLLDRERNILRCAAVHGLPNELIGHEAPADRGVSGEALARRRAVSAPDYHGVRDPAEHRAYHGLAHAIVAPVIWLDEPRGVLAVGSARGGHAFDQADADVLEAFAGLAALALRNAEAFEERLRQARLERSFYLIASVLGQPLSLAGAFDAVARAAAEALGGSFAAALQRRRSNLELGGAHELPEILAQALTDGLPSSETALHGAAQDRRILAAPTVAGDDRFGSTWRQLATEAGFSSLLAIPVQLPGEGESAGLVVVFFEEQRVFTDDDVELASRLGGAAKDALERGGLFEQERRARSLAQQLARTGSLLATELDPAAVLDEVVRRAPALVEVEACVIRVIEGGELVVSAVEGEGTESVLGTRSSTTGRLSADVAQSREPVAVEDALEDERLLRSDPLLELGYRAFLGVPLTAPEAALHGVLAVYAKRPRAWRDEEIEALLALAGNASAALSSAELYQRVAIEKERSVAILANIADGIVAVDRDGHVVLWNTAAEQITGVPGSVALGRTPHQVLGRRLEGDQEERGGNRLISLLRGDEEVWLSLSEAIMRDPAGAVAGRIYAFRDISADRLVEEVKSDFVSTVSQELRRPLTSIYGFAETLLRRDVLFGEEERRTFLGYIASESERLTTIVDALLSVARLDTGDLAVNLAPVDVSPIVEEVVAGVEPGSVNGHHFVVDLPDEPLEAEADAEKLRQVLAHLVENAVKYSPNGGTVTVAARRRSDAVEVSIADEGVGIPPAEQQRIFRKFYRGDAGGGDSREGVGGGTGLGLFIAQGLVTAMGGRIWVQSKEGEGSSFTFELPLAASAVETSAGG